MYLTMKKLFVVSALMSFVTFAVYTFSISNDNLELKIDEQNGRFSVYALLDDGAKRPLLVDEDPRTTMLTVLAGSKIYRMGDSFEFSQDIKQSSDSVDIIWESPSLGVIQRFELDTGTLAVIITVKNRSEQDLQIGIRYLLDTYLGERSTHFRADGLIVEGETDYTWATPYQVESSDSDELSVFIELSGTEITDPDRVVIANWKRLNDASWTFESNQSRDFNLLPYSINDSAVALYYEPQTVPSKTIRSVSFRLRSRDAQAGSVSFTHTSVVDKVDEELKEALFDEMYRLDTLIIKIDRYLDSGQPTAQSDIDELKSTLGQLEEKKDELSGRQ